MGKNANKELLDAGDPFARVAGVIRPLELSDDAPLRDCLPGIWPTVGDLNDLRMAMVRLGWTNSHKRTDR